MNEQLAHAVRKLVRSYLITLAGERTTGVVTATGPLMVHLPGDTAATEMTAKSTTYAPIVGETCVVERVGSTWVAVYAIEEL